MNGKQLIVLGIILLLNTALKALEDVENSVSITTEKLEEQPEVIPANTDKSTTEVISSIDRSSHYHPHHTQPAFHGFWKKKLVWRPRWVKTWKENKVYVAVWKKMWGPLLMNEWIPVPKPPPGWVKHSYGHGAVISSHVHPH